jgi:hypothetical protein
MKVPVSNTGILGHGDLSLLHFPRCGVKPVTVGCFTPRGNKKPLCRRIDPTSFQKPGFKKGYHREIIRIFYIEDPTCRLYMGDD